MVPGQESWPVMAARLSVERVQVEWAASSASSRELLLKSTCASDSRCSSAAAAFAAAASRDTARSRLAATSRSSSASPAMTAPASSALLAFSMAVHVRRALSITCRNKSCIGGDLIDSA